MSTTTIDHALRIWVSEDGYRKINSFLNKSKEYTYFIADNKEIEFEGKIYKTDYIINLIKTHMHTDTKEQIYYRGASNKSKSSYIKDTFMSVCTDKEQANAFVDDKCCLFKIIVEPDIKRIKIPSEYEYLLEDNLYWEYLGEIKGEYMVRLHKNHEGFTSLPDKKREKTLEFSTATATAKAKAKATTT